MKPATAKHETRETLPLFDSSTDPSARKHGNDENSRAAWEKVVGDLNQRQREVCDAVFHQRHRGATAKEVATALNKPLHAISGRFTELKDKQMLIPKEESRDGSRVCVHRFWVHGQ